MSKGVNKNISKKEGKPISKFPQSLQEARIKGLEDFENLDEVMPEHL